VRLRATFPVFCGKSRKLEDNLTEYGSFEEYLTCKAENNRDILAIKPKECSKAKYHTMCVGSIDSYKCIGCLACQIGIAKADDGVDETGIPSDRICYTYENLAKSFFRGNYVSFPSTENVARPILRRFNQYSGELDERNFTNPLVACYLWELSGGEAFVSCSPNQELSLDVSIVSGEREGHLDVTLRTLLNGNKYLMVAEGKRDIQSFLNDSSREQQKKYEDRITKIGENFGYIALFSYVIGGSEEPMYPGTTNGVPMFIRRNRFFADILRNGKRFVSIHALRGLGAVSISSGGKTFLENTLFTLFKNENVYGLVLGGAILHDGRKFVLEDLHKLLTIR